jgi:hypothetical protein
LYDHASTIAKLNDEIAHLNDQLKTCKNEVEKVKFARDAFTIGRHPSIKSLWLLEVDIGLVLFVLIYYWNTSLWLLEVDNFSESPFAAWFNSVLQASVCSLYAHQSILAIGPEPIRYYLS